MFSETDRVWCSKLRENRPPQTLGDLSRCGSDRPGFDDPTPGEIAEVAKLAAAELRSRLSSVPNVSRRLDQLDRALDGLCG